MATHNTFRNLHRLSARAVHTADEGVHTDGGGLELRVRGRHASWVLRYTSSSGRRREMGLGACDRSSQAAAGQSLTHARHVARQAREQRVSGVDPIQAREQARDAARATEAAHREQVQRQQLTLARVARSYHERVIEPTRSAKHAAQWISSLENHVPARLWQASIRSITAPVLLDFLVDLHGAIPETASRVRQRLEVIFEDAIFRELCSSNPARVIRRKLSEHSRRRSRGQFRSLAYSEMPEFVTQLRMQKGVAARALEFAILTASRTSEVVYATWDEFDLRSAIWTIPAERMKAREQHVVYLSPCAAAILEEMSQLGGRYVFPSPSRSDRPLSNMAQLTLLRRMKVDERTTVHGLSRVTFSTMAYETAAARPDVIEACLAHREQDRVARAYNRAQFAQERRILMLAWGDYVNGNPVQSSVVEFAQLKAA